MAPPPAPTLASASGITSSPKRDATAAQRRQTILLSSDDARRRRVFATLDSLCATQAARESLRAWQIAYARQVGKDCLLPAGESLVEDPSRGRRGSWARGRISATWKREPSLASSNGTDGIKTGVISRLRKFSAGRRSQLNAMEMGQSAYGSEGGGSVRGGYAGVLSEPGQAPAWARDGVSQADGERKMKVKRIRRVDHGF